MLTKRPQTAVLWLGSAGLVVVLGGFIAWQQTQSREQAPKDLENQQTRPVGASTPQPKKDTPTPGSQAPPVTPQPQAAQKTQRPEQAQTGKNVPELALPGATSNDLTMGTPDEQIVAIKLLAQFGTAADRQAIATVAQDTQQDMGVRLTAMEHMDWEQERDFLVETLQGDDGIAEAVLLMAGAQDLTPETQGFIEDAAYTAFVHTERPSTQLAVLDYLLEHHSPIFDDLIEQVSPDNLAPEEQEDLVRLIKTRQEELALINQ